MELHVHVVCNIVNPRVYIAYKIFDENYIAMQCSGKEAVTLMTSPSLRDMVRTTPSKILATPMKYIIHNYMSPIFHQISLHPLASHLFVHLHRLKLSVVKQ